MTTCIHHEKKKKKQMNEPGDQNPSVNCSCRERFTAIAGSLITIAWLFFLLLLSCAHPSMVPLSSFSIRHPLRPRPPTRLTHYCSLGSSCPGIHTRGEMRVLYPSALGKRGSKHSAMMVAGPHLSFHSDPSALLSGSRARAWWQFSRQPSCLQFPIGGCQQIDLHEIEPNSRLGL